MIQPTNNITTYWTQDVVRACRMSVPGPHRLDAFPADTSTSLTASPSFTINPYPAHCLFPPFHSTPALVSNK